jgi:hypothetical protein
MDLEERVRKAGREVVEIGEVDLGESRHRIAPEVYFAASG